MHHGFLIDRIHRGGYHAQATGKTIQDAAAEAEAAADYEIAELFDDIGSAASDDEDLAETVEEVLPEDGDEDKDEA